MNAAAPGPDADACHPAYVVWDKALTGYDFGPGHPLAPVRVDLTVRLARALGVLDGPGVRLVPPDEPAAADLLRVHAAEYVAAVVAAGGDPPTPDLAYGLGSDDNPVFPGMHEASQRVLAASVTAARAVWTGQAAHAVNVAGGLHHALRAAASGFCIYNDVAAAIAWLLENGAERVAYVDIDAHHGDGVQELFYSDPRVLTISLHESTRSLFPYRGGTPEETGAPGAEGSAVNVALPPGTGDEGWLRAFHAVVPRLLEAFAPQVLVTQHGCDSHALDPLAHLMLSVDGQRAATAALHRLAHEHAAGRWVATGGGGYELVTVVPRAWSHLLAEVAGRPLPPDAACPPAWREEVARRTGQTAPTRMTDGRTPAVRDWSEGYDPADGVDRSIMATRRAVFPAHGLDPMVDL
ncbi:MAG: acetoin utilization protein AcuC [Actinomycetota bacterium]